MMTYCPVVLTTNDGNVAAQVAISQRINGEIRYAVVTRMKGRVTVEKWARACRVRYRQLATHFHSNNNQSCYVEDTDRNDASAESSSLANTESFSSSEGSTQSSAQLTSSTEEAINEAFGAT